MPRFRIVQQDPMPYKRQILQFWEEYLPGTPPERFEWMNSGNPAGPSIWFFAIDSKNGDLAGTISVMPRQVVVNGEYQRAGILGDFMIGGKYRVFGPAFQLPKAVMKKLTILGIDFLYTIPNRDSIKVIERVGLRKVGAFLRLVKPLNLDYFMGKYMKALPRRFIKPFLSILSRAVSRETYTIRTPFLQEISALDPSFDSLSTYMRKTYSGIIGTRDSRYLEWRYLNNSFKAFRILVCRDPQKGGIQGYVIFYVRGNRIEIYDLLVSHKTYIYQLMKRLVAISRGEGYEAICIRVFEENPWTIYLKLCGFMDAKEDDSIYIHCERELPFDQWLFFSGDRNL